MGSGPSQCHIPNVPVDGGRLFAVWHSVINFGSGSENMKSRRTVIATLGLATTGLLAGCSSNTTDTGANDTKTSSRTTNATNGTNATKKIRAVIRERGQAIEDRDIDGYRGTLHPDSPVSLTEIEESFQQLPADYTIEVSVESVDIRTEGRAEAHVVETTPGSGGMDTRFNKEYELRTHRGEWLIYDSTTNNIKEIPSDNTETETETETYSVTEQWTADVGASASSPAVADGTVYIGGFDGTVYALDAAGGSEQWTFETGGEIRSSPAVTDGSVYIASENQNVYALDVDDGTEQWTFETSHQISSSPVVADGTVYIGDGAFTDGLLYAIDASDGTELWSFEPDSPVTTKPAVDDGTVYVGARSVYAVDAVDGTEQWKFGTGAGAGVPLTVSNNTVYCADGNDGGKLFALDKSDGTEKWIFGKTGSLGSSPRNRTAEFTRPTVANNTVYVGSKNTQSNSNRDENLYAVNAEDGTEQWSTQISSSEVRASPAVADGTVYAGGTTGNLVALDASDGSEHWTFDLGGLYSSPTVADSTVYVGAGILYALAEQ